jgi:menaquinol-cytochrome c reductase iron-sulfur subunit
VITGIVALPVAGFAVLPAFTGQDYEGIDLGPLDEYPEGEWREVTFLQDPAAGEVSRRTTFVRNNGDVNGEPSFTIISNRCVHLGCPVQVNGLPIDDDKKVERVDGNEITRIPTAAAAGFGCPCHGGQYDAEGNRTAGPPVRALDRHEFKIKDGRLLLGNTYSVGKVEGTGAEARIKKYELMGPGQHVDGPEALLYPIPSPR